MVFDNVSLTKDYQGPVLLLEEDHYVNSDFLHVLTLMNSEKKRFVFSYMEILFMKNECLLVSNGYLSNGLFIVNRYDSDVLVYYVIEW